jgi:hypothetical protein
VTPLDIIGELRDHIVHRVLEIFDRRMIQRNVGSVFLRQPDYRNAEQYQKSPEDHIAILMQI